MKYSLLSKYRKEIFGISIIWIIFFHISLLKFSNVRPLLFTGSEIMHIGFAGVEIFLLLSGFGLYFSLTHEYSIMHFYANRIKRIFVSYFLIGAPFFVYKDLILSSNLSLFIKDSTLITFWSEGYRAYWFIALIIPLYLLYPFIYNFLIDTRYPLLRVGLTICFIYVCLVYLKSFDWKIYKNLEIALTRIPSFLLGAYLGKMAYEEKDLSHVSRLFIIMGGIIGVLIIGPDFDKINWKCFRIFTLLIGLTFPFLLAMVLDFLCFDGLNRILRYLGNISLELYLAHVTLITLLLQTNIYHSLSNHYIFWYFIYIVFPSLIFSALLRAYIIPNLNKLFLRAYAQK